MAHTIRCERSRLERCTCCCRGRQHGGRDQAGEAGTFADEQAPGVIRPAPVLPLRRPGRKTTRQAEGQLVLLDEPELIPTTAADLVVLYPTVFRLHQPDDGPICAAFSPKGARCAELAGHEAAGRGHFWPVSIDDDPGDEQADLLMEDQFFGGGCDL